MKKVKYLRDLFHKKQDDDAGKRDVLDNPILDNPKSAQVFALHQIFVSFPELRTDAKDSKSVPLKLSFLVWWGITRFARDSAGSFKLSDSDRDLRHVSSRHDQDDLRSIKDASSEKITAIVRKGMHLIEETWDVFSVDTKYIQVDDVLVCRPYLGEVGRGFYDSCLGPLAERCGGSGGIIQKEDWWGAWIMYLEGSPDSGSEKAPSVSESVEDLSMHSQEALISPLSSQSTHMPPSTSVHITPDATVAPSEKHQQSRTKFAMGYQELFRLFSGKLRSSEMRQALLKVKTLEPFEQSYRSIVGNIQSPLLRTDVKMFLRLVLINENCQIRQRDVDEFIELCAPGGEMASFISFEDIRSLVARGSTDHFMSASIFIGTALNPQSSSFYAWHTVVEACAIYLFFEVPFRIAFEPFVGISDVWVLSTDLIVDILLTINFIINFVTAYQNKQSRWVCDHGKIIRHNLSHGFVWDALSILPVDWLMWWSGNANVAHYLRLIKLTCMFNAFRRKHRRGHCRISPVHTLARLLVWVFSIFHWASCAWFLVGGGARHHVHVDRESKTFEPSWYTPLMDRESYHFAALADLGDTRNAWSVYLVSYLWISTTVTTQGVIDDLLPQTYIELVCVIVILTMSITIFNYVVGSIGTCVMSWDEDIVQQRNRLGAVSAFLHAKGLKGELMQQIVSHFSSDEKTSSIPMSKIMPSLNISLQHEVASFIAGDYLQRTPLFHLCSGPMLDNVQQLLRDVDFLDGEFVFVQGNVAHEMFIVIRGSASLLVSNDAGEMEEDKIFEIGDSVGDLECFFQMRHIGSCKARHTGAVCLRLVREQLITILKMHPHDERTISSNAAEVRFHSYTYEVFAEYVCNSFFLHTLCWLVLKIFVMPLPCITYTAQR